MLVEDSCPALLAALTLNNPLGPTFLFTALSQLLILRHALLLSGYAIDPEALLELPLGITFHPAALLALPLGVSFHPDALLELPLGVSFHPGALLAAALLVLSVTVNDRLLLPVTFARFAQQRLLLQIPLNALLLLPAALEPRSVICATTPVKVGSHTTLPAPLPIKISACGETTGITTEFTGAL